jgi:hypothetical protein
MLTAIVWAESGISQHLYPVLVYSYRCTELHAESLPPLPTILPLREHHHLQSILHPYNLVYPNSLSLLALEFVRLVRSSNPREDSLCLGRNLRCEKDLF